MSDPVTIGLMAAGGLINAGSAISAGKDDEEAANARARQLEAQAQEVLRRSDLNQQKLKEEQKQFEGVQASGFARGGIDLGTGSPLLVMAETAIQFERDIVEERRQAEFEASQIRAGAASARESGKRSRRAGFINAGSGIINAGARIGAFTRSPSGEGG